MLAGLPAIPPGIRSTDVSELAFVRRTSWMSRSACKRADPELFFPSATDAAAPARAMAAKAVCARCPVRAECLAFALATRQKDGVWGGTTEDERRTMTRRNHPARRMWC
jgi:WhiB family transcriptional regulator, redox-sensing transcriptional regulator